MDRSGEIVPRIDIICFPKCPVPRKNYGACEEIGKGKKMKATKTTYERELILNLWEKTFKVAIINKLTELKKTIIKEVKEGMIIILNQIENMNKCKNI